MESWLIQPEEDLILGHHGVGQNIRNYYHLWHDHNPYSRLDDPMHDLFPDQISGRIIKRVWARVKEIAPTRGLRIPTTEEVAAEAQRVRDELRDLYRPSGELIAAMNGGRRG